MYKWLRPYSASRRRNKQEKAHGKSALSFFFSAPKSSSEIYPIIRRNLFVSMSRSCDKTAVLCWLSAPSDRSLNVERFAGASITARRRMPMGTKRGMLSIAIAFCVMS